ncbi:hypothetical protein MBLNU230_g1696t1 [Neophaeotheca triangularis]
MTTRSASRKASARQTPYPPTKDAAKQAKMAKEDRNQSKLNFTKPPSRFTRQNEPEVSPPKTKAEATNSTNQGNNTGDGEKSESSDEENAITYLKVTEVQGDLFKAPENTLILHACNCEGSWGAGVALAFKTHYPKAFEIYQNVCASTEPSKLIGTALLITREMQRDTGRTTNLIGTKMLQEPPDHHVGCLFTSKSKGKKKDARKDILKATKTAMVDLLREVKKTGDFDEIMTSGEYQKVERIIMPKINSGLFGVPWKATKDILESVSFAEGDEGDEDEEDETDAEDEDRQGSEDESEETGKKRGAADEKGEKTEAGEKANRIATDAKIGVDASTESGEEVDLLLGGMITEVVVVSKD